MSIKAKLIKRLGGYTKGEVAFSESITNFMMCPQKHMMIYERSYIGKVERFGAVIEIPLGDERITPHIEVKRRLCEQIADYLIKHPTAVNIDFTTDTYTGRNIYRAEISVATKGATQ